MKTNAKSQRNSTIAAILFILALLAIILLSSCTEKYYDIEIGGDSDTTIVNVTQNVYDTTINWNNPVITSKVIFNKNSAYCENGGWESEFHMDGDFLFTTPGPCIGITDTIYLEYLPEISFHSEKVQINGLCYAKKNFSEIDGEINLISIDTICSGEDGIDGQDGEDGNDGQDGSDGVDGQDGNDGHTPEIDIEVVELDSLCDSIKFYVDGIFAVGFEVCDGEQGPQGPQGPSDTVVVYDTTVIYDTIVLEGKSYVRETFSEDFNNSGNSSYYESIGWCLGRGWSINQIGSGSGNGTATTWSSYPKDTLWSPELFSEPMDIDFVSMGIGSKNPYLAKILFQNESGEIYSLDQFEAFKEGFDWQDPSTYKEIEYSSSAEELEFKNIVRVGIATEKNGSFTPSTRSEKFNSDNWVIRGRKLEE